MGLALNLQIKQGQSLVMTPQLLQAVKILQMSNLELSDYVQDEVEKNPLLESAGASESSASDHDAAPPFEANQQSLLANDEARAHSEDNGNSDFKSETLDQWPPIREYVGSERGARSVDSDLSQFDTFVARPQGLHEYLRQQLAIAIPNGLRRLIGEAIIESIETTGYLGEGLDEIAHRLSIDRQAAASVLATIQGFDPSGVGARDLSECLSIQLREKDRLDPVMQIFVANLPLLAKKDFVGLSRICGVDHDDIADMAMEVRALNPKPGIAYGDEPILPRIPDVFVRLGADGAWLVELNEETLPRVLVNNRYASQIKIGLERQQDKVFVSKCLENANWLVQSLEQRQKTILAVASELVRVQSNFFTKGVEYLRPLTMRSLAEVIGVHESTVSRATSQKYLSSPRGIFEMKYFFTSAIPGQNEAEAISSEALRFKIKCLIDQEAIDNILSDDDIVTRLGDLNVKIARRTVAKYREALGIPSSIERRKEKTLSRSIKHGQ
jgi:RNA polymerase sigma-54 factor